MKFLRSLQVGVRALASQSPTAAPARPSPAPSPTATPPPFTHEPPPSPEPRTCTAWPFDAPPGGTDPSPAPVTPTTSPAPVSPAPVPSAAPPTPVGMSLRPPTPPPGLRRPAAIERPAVDGSPVDPPPAGPGSSLGVEPVHRVPVNGTPPARPGSGLCVGYRVPVDRTPTTFTVAATPPAGLSSLSLAPVRSTPAPTPWRSQDTLGTAEIFRRAEELLGVFGHAMTIAQDRRASETLDVLLTAQHEHMAVFIQGMAEQRRDYGEALERAFERFARDMAPESILTVGETFRISAGEITGALRRGEHMQGRVLEALTGIRDLLRELAHHGAALTASVSAAKVEEARLDKAAPDKPALALVQPARKAAPESPLLHLDDDE